MVEEVIEDEDSWDDGEEVVVEDEVPDSSSSSVEHKRFRALPKHLSEQNFICCHVPSSSTSTSK